MLHLDAATDALSEVCSQVTGNEDTPSPMERPRHHIRFTRTQIVKATELARRAADALLGATCLGPRRVQLFTCAVDLRLPSSSPYPPSACTCARCRKVGFSRRQHLWCRRLSAVHAHYFH